MNKLLKKTNNSTSWCEGQGVKIIKRIIINNYVVSKMIVIILIYIVVMENKKWYSSIAFWRL